MSRCYPFPPPGYVRNVIGDESLMEPIKKGTEEDVKRDRKHKKDKKRKERDTDADQSKKHRRHKRRCKDESANASKKVDDGCRLVTNNDLECLEKSCLTVELEQQTSSSQNSCDSRPNHIQSPPLYDRQYGSETSLRVLLHGKEHECQDASQKQCSSGESLDASQSAPSEFVARPSANEAPLDPLSLCQEKRRREITTKLSKEKKTVPLCNEKPSSSYQETVGASKLCRKRPSSTAMRFLNLIENWAPERVESKLIGSEDQELWLVMKVGAKRHRHHQVSNQTTSNGISSMAWPSARFLPEANLHALPFTVPF